MSISFGPIHEQRKQRKSYANKYSRNGSEEVSKTRLASMRAAERKRTFPEDDDMDTSVIFTGEGRRVPVDVAGNSVESLSRQGVRRRAGDPHVAFVADKEVLREQAPGRIPALMAQRNATHASSLGEADSASSAWFADECCRVLGQE